MSVTAQDDGLMRDVVNSQQSPPPDNVDPNLVLSSTSDVGASWSDSGQTASDTGGSTMPDWNDVKIAPGQSPTVNGKLDILGILERDKYLNAEQIKDVRLMQLNTGKQVEDLLVEKGLIDKKTLFRVKAEVFDIPIVNLTELAVSPEALALVPQSVARKFVILPFDYDKINNVLSVVMADATDLGVISFLEKKTRTQLKPVTAPSEELSALIEERYGASLSTEVHQVISESELGRSVQLGNTLTDTVVRDAPIAKIVSYILEYAMKMRASDVHIEPEDERTRVRYRIDGILHEKLVLPKQVQEALVSRIKILGGMKIDEKRIPQDGRFNFHAGSEEVDLRVSSLPTVHGEKVVMRLLKKSGGVATLSELGLRGKALKNLEETILRPHGIVLVTGPTGSGKTTTLYSIITKINTPKVNILTLEDPVEYQMKGVNQVQINPGAGLTFADGLRSFLRQDPNVIMVGEVRDNETADLAIQAALTGHLVFSTLHTNNAAGSLPRLLDMGAEPFLLASTINAVMAQRVVRTICTHCKKPYDPAPAVVKDLQEVLGNLLSPESKKIQLFKGEGCAECNSTGYIGRVGIFEVLPISEKIGRLIMERSAALVIEKQASEEGMVTMKQDGYLKAIEGITTIEEVLRVAQD